MRPSVIARSVRGVAVVLGLLLCAQAQAASLRTMTTLHGPNVYLRDLFDDAGVNANRVLGPGPAPGGRIIVEAAQLNAIARQYDVAWRSVSRADRAVLEWPGHPMRRDQAIDAVRVAITAGGGADDLDIDLPGFIAPIVPVEAKTSATVSQMEYDPNTGRFTADLTVSADGMDPIDSRISGRADAVVDAPVAITRLLPDTILRPDDVHFAHIHASLANDVARSPDQVVGMQLRRPLAAGQPLRLADLVRPPLVQRGATVLIQLAAAGLSVTGQAVALDAGAEGERIRVQNITSHAYLFAQVIGPGQVRVTPDAPPALPRQPPRYEQRVDLQ